MKLMGPQEIAESVSPKVVAFRKVLAAADGLDVYDFMDVLANAAVASVCSTVPRMARQQAQAHLDSIGPNMNMCFQVNWPEGKPS